MTAVSETRRFGASSPRQAALAKLGQQVMRATGLTAAGGILLGTFVACWLLARVVAGRPVYLFPPLLPLVLVFRKWGVRGPPLLAVTRPAVGPPLARGGRG